MVPEERWLLTASSQVDIKSAGLVSGGVGLDPLVEVVSAQFPHWKDTSIKEGMENDC